MVFGSEQVVGRVGAVMHETRVCGCLVRTIKDRTLVTSLIQVHSCYHTWDMGAVRLSRGKVLLC